MYLNICFTQVQNDIKCDGLKRKKNSKPVSQRETYHCSCPVLTQENKEIFLNVCTMLCEKEMITLLVSCFVAS